MLREAKARRGALPVQALSLAGSGGSEAVARWVRGLAEQFGANGRVGSSIAGVADDHHHGGAHQHVH